MYTVAHAWVKPERIVYASSTRQLTDLAADTPPLTPLSIIEIAPVVSVDGPHPTLAQKVFKLHRRYYGQV